MVADFCILSVGDYKAGKSRKTAENLQLLAKLGGILHGPDLSIAQLLTGIQGDLKRFLEAY
jgi:hypothetical protein